MPNPVPPTRAPHRLQEFAHLPASTTRASREIAHDHMGRRQVHAHGEGGAAAMDAYFECITTCSLEDGECVTRCVEQLRDT